MYDPRAAAGRKTRRQTVRFGGLNYTESPKDGELVDSRGISWQSWPCLDQRQGRRLVRAAPEAVDLFAFGAPVTVERGRLCYDGQAVGALEEGEKQFAAVGRKLCIFPDRKYLDLDTLELRDLGARALLADHSVTFEANALTWRTEHAVLGEKEYTVAGSRSYVDGFRYKVFDLADVAWDPATGWDPGMGWEEKNIYELKKGDCLMLPCSPDRQDRNPDYSHPGYDGYADVWDTWGDFVQVTRISWDRGASSASVSMTLERRCAAIRNADLTTCGFQVGDVVRLSGCVTFPENNGEVRIRAVEADRLVFDAPLPAAGREQGAVTAERFVPAMDYICAGQGRLFGVSNADKCVYASAPGDPTNFLGDSGGCIGVSTGGDFTGCAAYAGKVLFFQEDCLYRLMGSRPQDYTLYADQVPGVQKGSHRSLCAIGGALYYKGTDGVYAYTGSVPKLVSAALGNARYTRAVGGSDGAGYYLSMRRQDTGTWEVLVYNTQNGLWTKEEQRQVTAFAMLDGTLYMLSQGQLIALGQGGDDAGAPIAWEATFAPFDETTHRRKYPSRLLLRLELEEGGWVEAELARDRGPFRPVWTGRHSGALTAVIPLRPGRCDRYQLRLKGEGRCLLRSMEREFSLGGVR